MKLFHRRSEFFILVFWLWLAGCATTSSGLDECTYQTCIRDRIRSEEREAVHLDKLKEIAAEQDAQLVELKALIDELKECR